MSWSVVIPKVGAVHFNGLTLTGTSRCCSNRNVLHFERGKMVGRTVLNPLGEPNHVAYNGIPVGFSRKKRRTKMVHFSRKGRPIGYSRCLFCIWIHYGRITKEGWVSE